MIPIDGSERARQKYYQSAELDPIANWQFWITIAQDVVSGQLYAILEWWEISMKDEDFLASYLLVK